MKTYSLTRVLWVWIVCALVYLLSGCEWQRSDAQAVGPTGLSRVNHSGGILSGSGTTANPLTVTISETTPLSGAGTTASPIVYGLSPMGGYFGDGSDGACSFDGTTTPVAGATGAASAPYYFYTMQRDIQCTTISITGSNTILYTQSYRVLARDSITINVGATSQPFAIYNGGVPASTVTAGAARIRGSTCAGGAGGASQGSGGVGAVGTGATASGQTRCHPRSGGGTGAGGAGVNAGGAAPSTGSTASAANGDIVASAWNAISLRFPGNAAYGQTCGAGGSSGGGGGTAGRRGGAGGGGGAGLIVAAPTIIATSGDIGGQGGGGGDALSGGAAAGGGGGGEGSLVVVVTADNTAQTVNINNDGGAGGLGAVGGANGQQGANGCAIRWSLQ